MQGRFEANMICKQHAWWLGAPARFLAVSEMLDQFPRPMELAEEEMLLKEWQQLWSAFDSARRTGCTYLGYMNYNHAAQLCIGYAGL